MKKLFACLMVLVLMLSILAIPAAAEGESESGSQTAGNESGTTSGEESGGSGESGSGTGEGGTDSGESGTGSGEGSSGSGESGGSSGESSGESGSGSEGETGTCKHTWVGGKVIPATCKEAGYREYSCSTCGATGKEEIPKLDHTYDNSCDAECNVCGATREVEHKPSAVWSKNSRKHWYACTVCGAQTSIADHYPGPAATEDRDQYCLTCGLLMTPKLTHTHKYAEIMTTDESGHWYTCEGCEEKGEYGAHSFDNSCDPDCNVCGYVIETAHSFDGEWFADETSHWLTCVHCGQKGEAVAHVASEGAAEEETQVCVVCGYELAPTAGHIHEPGEQWLTDEISHWRECECGEKLEAASHSWDDGTENEDGTVTYVCKECLAEKTEGEPEAIAEEETTGIPWGLVLVVLVMALAGVVVALVLVLRSNKKPGKYGRQ